MSTRTLHYSVRVHHEEDDTLWAEVIDLPGCFASGHTLDELKEALEEAISLYLTDDPDAGTISRMEKPSQRRMEVDELRVTVPA